MRYIKLLKEFLENPENAKWEAKRMLKELETLMQKYDYVIKYQITEMGEKEDLRIEVVVNSKFFIENIFYKKNWSGFETGQIEQIKSENDGVVDFKEIEKDNIIYYSFVVNYGGLKKTFIIDESKFREYKRSLNTKSLMELGEPKSMLALVESELDGTERRIKSSETENISRYKSEEEFIPGKVRMVGGFFEKWLKQFEKTNISLARKYVTYNEFRIEIHLKGLKFYKWQSKSIKKLFHFSSAANRDYILRNGIKPTDNKRSTDIFGLEVSTIYPAVYAIPEFDFENNKSFLGKLFKIEIFPTTEMTNITIRNNETREERLCTIVKDESYSINSSDMNKKVETPWTILIDENVTEQFQLESKYSGEIGLFSKVNLNENSFRKDGFKPVDKMQMWTIVQKGYTIDLWEIDLDKIKHTWWADPVQSPIGFKKEAQDDFKWLISYDGTIPPDALRLRKIVLHQTDKI
jgi:hypothetical protein